VVKTCGNRVRNVIENRVGDFKALYLQNGKSYKNFPYRAHR